MTRKIESEIKNIASKNCTPRRQIYDSHATKESNFHPFVKLQWMNAGKKYHPYSPLLKVQKCSETEIRQYCTALLGIGQSRWRNFFPNFKPAEGVVDFQTTLFSSRYFNFESQMQECLFRYRQALWRTCSRLGVGKDEEVLKWLKKLMPLPLFPENKIELCLHALAPTVDIKAKSKSDEVVWFYNCIEKYWIQKIPLGLLSVPYSRRWGLNLSYTWDWSMLIYFFSADLCAIMCVEKSEPSQLKTSNWDQFVSLGG